MYKKILIPTDGSELAQASVKAGMEFARQIQAKVYSVFIASQYQYPIYIDVIPPDTPSESDYRKAMLALGENYFQTVREVANEFGVVLETITQFNDSAAREIVHSAEQFGCDLIFMGSHGRSGMQQFLLGSTTSKVLSLCDIPVLVHRIKHSRHS